MTDFGWYCFSTSQGGGAVELVQHLYPAMNSFDVGRWLLERGISSISGETRSHVSHALVGSACPPPAPSPVAHELASLSGGDVQVEPAKESKENEPIRQDLRPSMDPHHPLFAERGISVEILRELGAGLWQRKRPKKGDAPDPLNGRLVFQIRGLRNAPNGTLTSVILSHMGRAVTPEQEAQGGKWCFFHGFRKSLELYNIDLAVLDPEAREQAQSFGHVIVVEGCFDAAKLFCAGIKNVVATFGSHLSREQIPRFELLASQLEIRRILVWYDRDQDGNAPHGLGAQNAVSLLEEYGFEASAFDWNYGFRSKKRGDVRIPESITDPAEFTVEQVRWLREKGVI